MGINNLPGAGEHFRAKLGSSSFKKKLSHAVRSGSLKGLQDNMLGITGAVNKYEKAIRRGSFNTRKQVLAWKKVRSIEGNKLTSHDKTEIKKIFRYLGEGKPSSSKVDSSPKVAKTRAPRLQEKNYQNPYSLQPRSSSPRSELAPNRGALNRTNDSRTSVSQLGKKDTPIGGSLANRGQDVKLPPLL